MNRLRNTLILITFGFLLISLFLPQSSYATEGGSGKPITGCQVLQYGAIVPPHPGWVFAFNPVFYSASLGGSKQLPIVGLLAANVDANIGFAMFGITRIWATDTKRWNFASAAMFPLAYTDITANVILGPFSGQASDNIFSQFDMVFVPVIASYHISQLEHIAFNLTIWAPTGDYEEGRLANNGMNVWSFLPNIAYTKIWPSGLSFDATYGMEFDTENKDTNYQNGILTNLDVLVAKKYKSGWSAGGIFGWLQQYSGDEGGLADRLDGFKGRAVGIGPYLGYSTKIGQATEFSLNGRVIFEFATEHRPKGYPIVISSSFIF